MYHICMNKIYFSAKNFFFELEKKSGKRISTLEFSRVARMNRDTVRRLRSGVALSASAKMIESLLAGAAQYGVMMKHSQVVEVVAVEKP